MKDVAQSPSARRYSAVAIVLHWIIAAAIVAQIVLAGRMEGPASPEVFAAVQLHKSVGVTILLLTLVRLGWRLANPPPPYDHPLAPYERRLAGLIHVGFYVLTIAIPLTGWIAVSTSRFDIPTLLFGVAPWPHLPGLAGLEGGAREMWHEIGEVGHDVLVKGLYVLLALHVAGALKHQLIKPGEPVLARMAPGAKAGRRLEPRIALIVIGAIVAAAFGRFFTLPATTPSMPPAAGAVTTADPPAPQAATAATASTAEAPQAAPEAASKPDVWRVEDGSRLAFATTWGDAAIDGRFERWTGDIRFSPEALAASRVRIEIDLGSVQTGDAQRDQMLPSQDWFDAGAHPTAVFEADRFERTGADRYIAQGRLTLRGVTRAVRLPFELKIDGDRARVRGVTSLDRTQFGVGQGQWTSTDQIPATVSVSLDLKARRSPTP
jgi:cytochrome b561/polyisoprenoid-binding protein YceI